MAFISWNNNKKDQDKFSAFCQQRKKKKKKKEFLRWGFTSIIGFVICTSMTTDRITLENKMMERMSIHEPGHFYSPPDLRFKTPEGQQ